MTTRDMSRFIRLWIVFLLGFTSVGVFAKAAVSKAADPKAVAVIQKSLYHSVWSPGGIVAAQEAVAARVGVNILKAGGNAVDAAVATGFALAVTLPKAGNLGGGGFMLIWLAKEHKALAVNYREMAPQAASRDMYLDAHGKVNRALATRRYLSSGVPGTVAGLTLVQHKYGKLSLARVMRPAVALAEHGIRVTKAFSESLASASGVLKKDPVSRHKFFTKEGKPLAVGSLWKQPHLAETLKLIAKKGASAFYQGKIAKQIVSGMEQHGGKITLEDLKKYQAKVVPAVRGTYRGYRVFSMPPPSSGGITLIEMLNILENYDLPLIGSNNAQYFHLLTEAMNYAYNDRNYYLGDPDFVNIPQKRLVSKSYARTLFKKIDPKKHTPAIKISYLKPVGLESKNTTHYSVIDKVGNMVANTYTLNQFYGNGHTVPGAGFLLNDEMDDFTAKLGVPNSYGLIQGKANTIAPGKRPLSSMTPTLVLTPEGKPFFATGTPGGSRIITTTLQVILNRIDQGLNLAGSVSAPRIHSQLWPDQISYEKGVSEDTLVKLREMGHKVVPSHYTMGAAHSAEYLGKGKGTLGASDPRRSGALAVGEAKG